MEELASYEGRRVEVEVDGKTVRGRVVRGPGRRHMLLEERGPVGDACASCHDRLGLLRIWRPRQLAGVHVLKVLPNDTPPARPARRRRKPEWTEAVEIAAGDPRKPPTDWEGGQLAWAEAVYAARRQVDRGRRAMLKALKKAAG